MNQERVMGVRSQHLVVALCVFLILVVPFATSRSLTGSLDQDEVVELVTRAIINNCEADTEARERYRERAIYERQLLRLEAISNWNLSAQSEFSPKVRRTFARAARREQKLADKIDLLPIRECGSVRDALNTQQ